VELAVVDDVFEAAADEAVVPPHPANRRPDANSVSERTLRRLGLSKKNLLLIIASLSLALSKTYYAQG